jgi:hypothetical protein
MPIGRQVLTADPLSAAGQRDKRVLIEEGTESVGASGFPVMTWAPLRYEMMARKDVRADERYDAAQESAYAETTWYANYAEDMDPDALNLPKLRRLNYRGRIYDIRVAVIIGRNRGLELMTLAQV